MKFLRTVFSVALLLSIAGLVAMVIIIRTMGAGLPDYTQLEAYHPPVVTRMYAADGRVLAELASEKRIFVPIKSVPPLVIQAFLSAEDKNFYAHSGVDGSAIIRAALTNIKNYAAGRRLVGASTITQQVAKNFLLSNEVTYARKIKEALLAMRIEKALSKDRILELYLNEIFLGQRSYGVAAAAVTYFNKSLDELTVAEAAYLAVLPKAPNNYHPVRNKDAAYDRRNWIVGEMRQNGFISKDQADIALQEPIVFRSRPAEEKFEANYFAEDVRRELLAVYGDKNLMSAGLVIRTSVDPVLQDIASRVMRQGLVNYDRRHGWRGPLQKIPSLDRWSEALEKIALPNGASPWRLAVVLEVTVSAAKIGFSDQSIGTIPLAELKWARAWVKKEYLGPEIKKSSDVLVPGDVILVEPVIKSSTGTKYAEATYGLRQIPAVQGGLVALDPHTGRILAMVGGFDQKAVSGFNRATQALRQPGSAFKPFIYLAALDKGFTPSSLVLDAPVVVDQGPELPLWRPSNYSEDFLGPTTLRAGIEKSRNVMTVRLAQSIGMDTVAEYARRLGVIDHLQETLAMALGAGETTVMKMATAYAVLVNGGKKITPTLIDRIQDHEGRTVYKHDVRPCSACQNVAWQEGLPVPDVPDVRDQLLNPLTAYQMVSILEGVVQRGTGRVIASVNKPLAGKTGTTNDSKDAWFVGFSPDLVVGLYVGFDQPRPLGAKETGGTVAAPIFRDFMLEALADQPAMPFRIPPGLRLTRVNPETGLIASPDDKKAIWEAFLPGTEPGSSGAAPILGGESEGAFGVPASPSSLSDGLY